MPVNCLPVKDVLRSGQRLEASNGIFSLRLEADGRLCRYRSPLVAADWCTELQNDCSRVYWGDGTMQGKAEPDVLRLQAGGILTINSPFRRGMMRAGLLEYRRKHLPIIEDMQC
mmetsp:Transcript_10679/g.17736  ORF Transcript_10679/g.17736 Transcript_10679/m.17736 type:complete len:114 (+) Transcript_10679:319-660(+)